MAAAEAFFFLQGRRGRFEVERRILIKKTGDSFSGHLFFHSYAMRKLYEKAVVEQMTKDEAISGIFVVGAQLRSF